MRKNVNSILYFILEKNTKNEYLQVLSLSIFWPQNNSLLFFLFFKENIFLALAGGSKLVSPIPKGSIICPNRTIAKDVSKAAMSDAIKSKIRGIALVPKRRNSIPCTAQVGLPDKGCAIKVLIVCNSWDLEPWNLLNGLALGFYQPSPEV